VWRQESVSSPRALATSPCEIILFGPVPTQERVSDRTRPTASHWEDVGMEVVLSSSGGVSLDPAGEAFPLPRSRAVP
jgi:hypothetical protein